MSTKNTSILKKFFTFEWMSLIFAILLTVFAGAFGTIALTIWWFYFIVHHRDFLCNIMGEISMGSRRYSNSISFFKQSAKTTIADIKYIKKYVIVELKYGDAEKAEKTIEQIKKIRKDKWINENKLDLDYLLSLIYWKLDKIDKSLEILNEILQNEANEEIYGTLAYMKLIKGNYEDSLEFSKIAYQKYPKNIIAKSIFAISAYLTDNIDLAEELFDELLSNNLNIPDTFYYYAKHMVSKGDYEKAANSLKKGLILFNRTIICSVSKEDFLYLQDEVRDELDKIEDEKDMKDDFDDQFDDEDYNGFDEIASDND